MNLDRLHELVFIIISCAGCNAVRKGLLQSPEDETSKGTIKQRMGRKFTYINRYLDVTIHAEYLQAGIRQSVACS